jgi:glycosyltransferase involved in cell wall biosynthesis
MRVAVFTNQFPGLVSTFFCRDMRGLIEEGFDIEIFPIRPLDASLWRLVPDILNEKILPRDKVHNLTLGQCLRSANCSFVIDRAPFLRDTLSIGGSAIRFGFRPLIKTVYSILKAWAWANLFPNNYDAVLGYWGNYAGTCAYLYHRMSGNRNPFIIFLHANADLYRDPIYMKAKVLYADKIITCSEFNQTFITQSFSDLNELIREKIFVHYHGLDFAELPFRFGGRPAVKVLGVGRFVKQKGFDYLLRAAHVLKCRGVRVDLELVGDGEEGRGLRSLAQELNLMDRVKFRGWLPADEVPSAIGQATVLVHPSPDVGDGVPNVIKEAMAVGTPVIGSMVAGIPELLDNGNCGMLVPPKNVTALADAIQTMLADDVLREKYAQTARKSSEQKFDLWQNGRRLASALAATVRQKIKYS